MNDLVIWLCSKSTGKGIKQKVVSVTRNFKESSRKLRIKKGLWVVTLGFWVHSGGKKFEFESHVLSRLEYSMVSGKPVKYKLDKSHSRRKRRGVRSLLLITIGNLWNPFIASVNKQSGEKN